MDDKGQRGTTQDGFRVVCLCGSAGALEAYGKIPRALPADTRMAFVIAAHRGMEHAELLPRLLAEVTGMPVTEIEEGLRLEPNRIFLMPPHMHMTMAGPVLRQRLSMFPCRDDRTARGCRHSLRHGRRRERGFETG